MTLKKDAVGDWWVCFSSDEVPNHTIQTTTGRIEGFDFGLKTFLTLSEAKPHQSPQYLKKSLKKLALASRKLSRKVKGSNRRKFARRSLAKLHRHVAFQRSDYHFKLANELCREYQYLVFEDLNLSAMGRLWGRKVNDLGFGDFKTILESKAKEHGCEVIKLDPFFPSSKLCSGCGHKKEELSLKDRVYCCDSCSLKICRDRNAAINIKVEGASSINAMIGVRLASVSDLSVRIPRL